MYTISRREIEELGKSLMFSCVYFERIRCIHSRCHFIYHL